jgi:hypothetical protein
MATGSYATTLPPVDPSLRGPPPPPPSSSASSRSIGPGPLRKRRQPTNQTIIDTEDEEAKRPRLEGSYQGLEVAITQLARSRRNVLQLAIELLETEYSTRLTSEHMQMAIDILEIEAKSSIFISIQDQITRDQWLERQAGVEVLN